MFTSIEGNNCLVSLQKQQIQILYYLTQLQMTSNNMCHSDLDSCAPEVMAPDARVFSSIKNEQKYPWLYDSVVHQVYLCKFCELFCGHSSSSQ